MKLKSRLFIAAATTTLAISASLLYTSHITETEVESRTVADVIRIKQIVWDKVIGAQIERMRPALFSITRSSDLMHVIASGARDEVAEHALPIFRRLHASNVITDIEIIDQNGKTLFSSSADSSQQLGLRIARIALRDGKVMRGIERANAKLFALTASPLYRSPGRPIGAIVLAKNLRDSVEEFKLDTGSEVYVYAPNGSLEHGSDSDLIEQLEMQLPVLGKHLKRDTEIGGRAHQILVQPLKDYAGFPAAHLVTVDDVTSSWSQHRTIHNIASLLNVLVVLFGLAALTIFMSRSFARSMAHAKSAQQSLKSDINERTLALEEANRRMENEIVERRLAEDNARRLAFNDALTGLPNRTKLQSHLTELLAELSDDKLALLLLIDLDSFGDFNETLGHDNGDRVLQEVARRLRKTQIENSTVFALGGDEFAVVVQKVTDASEMTHIAQQLVREMERPLPMLGLVLDIRPNVGFAYAPAHGKEAGELMQAADVALHRAKKSHSGFELYNESLDQFNPHRLSLMGELRNAILKEELQLFYQPLVTTDGGTFTGVEALVRWNHPRLGPLSPSLFIEPAEQTGLIRPLTQWVLNTALRQGAAWRKEGLDINLSINLSSRNLYDDTLPKRIDQLLAGWEIPTDRITLEITESAIMDDPDRSLRILSELYERGIKLAIDDFGTGYSSLAYLRNLPVNRLKIDKSFVDNIDSNKDDAVIVRSVIDLAHSLGMEVVTEGVENKQTYDLLVEMGSDIIQGYYLSRPISAREITAWAENSAWSARYLKKSTTVTEHPPVTPG